MNKLRRVLAVLAVGLCALWLALPAGAQAWPPKTIRIIVPFPPGGTTDLIARRIQPMLERNLKTSILIENRGGASGAIGTQAAVARRRTAPRSYWCSTPTAPIRASSPICHSTP